MATLDLKLVQSIRSAIRAADIASGRTGPQGTFPPLGPREQFHATPHIDPRRVIHPTPRYEPRITLHPKPNIQPQLPVAMPEPGPAPEHRCASHSPIEPPWKLLPWKTPIQPASHIKVVVHRTDVINKGSLIDFFI